MNKREKNQRVMTIFFGVIMIAIAIGSIVVGIILLKESTYLGIGIYLGGQLVAGLPLAIIFICRIKKLYPRKQKVSLVRIEDIQIENPSDESLTLKAKTIAQIF